MHACTGYRLQPGTMVNTVDSRNKEDLPLGTVRRQTLQLQIAQADRKITRGDDGRNVSGYWNSF